jgi:hypothetical protein
LRDAKVLSLKSRFALYLMGFALSEAARMAYFQGQSASQTSKEET